MEALLSANKFKEWQEKIQGNVSGLVTGEEDEEYQDPDYTKVWSTCEEQACVKEYRTLSSVISTFSSCNNLPVKLARALVQNVHNFTICKGTLIQIVRVQFYPQHVMKARFHALANYGTYRYMSEGILYSKV